MLYIRRHKEGVIVRNKKNEKIIHTSIMKHINNLCIENMATYEGRITAVKKILNIKSNIPVYVNKQIILYPTRSIRDYNTVFVNYNEVLSINMVNKTHTRFIFTNLDEEVFEVSYQKTVKQHSKIVKIINYLDNRE